MSAVNQSPQQSIELVMTLLCNEAVRYSNGPTTQNQIFYTPIVHLDMKTFPLRIPNCYARIWTVQVGRYFIYANPITLYDFDNLGS